MCFRQLFFLVLILLGLGLTACQRATDRQSEGSLDVSSDVTVRVEQIDEPEEDVEVTTQSAKPALRYIGWTEGESADQPKICFEFHSPLDSSDTVKLRDYYEVSPETQLAILVNGRNLCLTGFEYAQDYMVTLKAGLTDKSGKTLETNIRESISFGDKPAYVGFAGEGIILPRLKAQGLAVETVNIDEINVEIARVSDRMMARRDPQSGRVTLEGDYGWEYQDAATNIRETIWSGQINVKNIKNKTVTTIIPLNKLAGELEPGAFVVTASRKHDEDESRYAKAWRWIISTDMAITSYWGEGGLTTSVRSINSGALIPQTELLLVAENNDVLASQTTNVNGYTEFAPALLNGKGPKAPKMIMAYGSTGDYAMLDLSRAPLDLSEFSIDGRVRASRIDIYGYPERGVYRPGETAYFTLMSRDKAGLAIYDTPYQLSVKRPNGFEIYSERIDQERLKQTLGTIVWSYEIPSSAPRGVWTLHVKPDGSDKSTRIGFSVEDFVPQTLGLSIDVDDTPLKSDEIRDVTLDAQFLYGAPGGALEGEAEARLRIDPTPFDHFKDYQFGPRKTEFKEQLIEMNGGVTDGKGQLTLALDLKTERIESSHPLLAEITAGVAEPGGRYVRDSVRVPILTQETYLGLDPLFDRGRVQRGKSSEYKIIALDRSGNPVAQDVTWRLIEEDWDYHWFRRQNGRWSYRRDVRDIPLAEGTLSVAEDGSTVWSRRLDWGNYRLDIETESGAMTSSQFSVGWARSSQTDAPDQISIAVDNEAVSSGDMINLVVNAPYSGEAELVIANNKVRMIRPVNLSEGGSNLSFKMNADWGSSVYAMLTLYTAREPKNRPVPRRAVGIAHIELDRTPQTLKIDVGSPNVIRPNTKQKFAINIENTKNMPVWINFAAVDEGILRLTKYSAPDAPGYFFGKKALGVDIRDDYGRILNPNLGAPAIVKTGGDSLGGEGLTVVPTKTVSLFTGPFKTRNGKAEIELEMPQFNGELRLMATAWSETGVGSYSGTVKLRDKVPALIGLPRFLAPGDEAVANISLDNVEGEAGLYNVRLKTTDVITSTGSLALELASSQRKDGTISLNASQTGLDDITLSINGPQYKVQSSYPIQVRSAYKPISQVTSRLLEPGERFTLGSDLVSEFVKGSTDVTVSFSRLPGLDPAPYVNSLARYPYGCTEQTVSTAMPLLYADNLGGIPGQSDKERRRGLKRAIAKLSSRQSLDGAFGLWREGDRYAKPWLGVYVTDFLYRAQEDGLYVSDEVLDRAAKAIGEMSRMPRYPNLSFDFPRRGDSWADRQNAEVAAYAHFVLARTGQGDLGQMRYFYDNHSGAIRSPMAQAYITAALAMMGDKRRVDKSLALTLKKLGYEDDKDYYQSGLRDLSGSISALSDAKLTDSVVELAEAFKSELEEDDRLHTNEKAHVILAINALMSTADNPKVSASNAKIDGSDKRPFVQLYGKDLAQKPEFKSQDENKMWATITVNGAPKAAPLPQSKGFTLSKTVYDMKGAEANLAQVKQGDRFVIKLSFQSDINRSRTAVIADLLPAGFEIETVLTSEDGSQKNGVKGAYDWVGNVSKFQVTEARDDRFVASLETYRQDKYIAAYIVRAVTPGDFAIPGAVLEDMYRPEDIAISKAGRVLITADPSL